MDGLLILTVTHVYAVQQSCSADINPFDMHDLAEMLTTHSHWLTDEVDYIQRRPEGTFTQI